MCTCNMHMCMHMYMCIACARACTCACTCACACAWTCSGLIHFRRQRSETGCVKDVCRAKRPASSCRGSGRAGGREGGMEGPREGGGAGRGAAGAQRSCSVVDGLDACVFSSRNLSIYLSFACSQAARQAVGRSVHRRRRCCRRLKPRYGRPCFVEPHTDHGLSSAQFR